MVGQALPKAHQGGEEKAWAFLRRGGQEEDECRQRQESSALHLGKHVLLSTKPVLEHFMSFVLFSRQGGPRLRQTQTYPAEFGRVVASHHFTTMAWV